MKRETKAEAVTAIEVDSTHTFDCICGACQRDRVNNPLTSREKKLILRNGILRAEKAELLESLRDIAERGPVEGYTSADALKLRLVLTQTIARAAIAKAERGEQ